MHIIQELKLNVVRFSLSCTLMDHPCRAVLSLIYVSKHRAFGSLAPSIYSVSLANRLVWQWRAVQNPFGVEASTTGASGRARRHSPGARTWPAPPRSTASSFLVKLQLLSRQSDPKQDVSAHSTLQNSSLH